MGDFPNMLRKIFKLFSDPDQGVFKKEVLGHLAPVFLVTKPFTLNKKTIFFANPNQVHFMRKILTRSEPKKCKHPYT